MIGVGIMSACSCWLMIWVWSWPLLDINHAHPYPTREVDMAGWMYTSGGASTALEQWCLCREETLRESHHMKKLWTLNNRTAAVEDIRHPWWGQPFLLTTVEYTNHARKYITKCLYSKNYYRVMQRDLGEIAKCMKVPFSILMWKRIKINYDI